jgi:hypothetical protein
MKNSKSGGFKTNKNSLSFEDNTDIKKIFVR